MTYLQKDEVAMGSPLGSIFANIFMLAHEISWLKNTPYKLILYRRYIDDTFLVFKSNTNIKKIENFLNIQRPNIKFTFKEEIDGCILFIGINLHCYLGNTYTTVYTKAMFKGLYVHY